MERYSLLFLFRSSFTRLSLDLKLSNKNYGKKEGMEDLLLRYYEGETTEDETAFW